MKPFVLLAEGDGELRDLCRNFLLTSGYEVETACSALDCVESLRRMKPAILVLDLDLRWGGADGVLAWLNEQQDCAPRSVILTGLSPALEKFHQPRGATVVHFLRKPYHPSRLFQSVRHAAQAVRDDELLDSPTFIPVRGERTGAHGC